MSNYHIQLSQYEMPDTVQQYIDIKPILQLKDIVKI